MIHRVLAMMPKIKSKATQNIKSTYRVCFVFLTLKYMQIPKYVMKCNNFIFKLYKTKEKQISCKERVQSAPIAQ